MEKVTITKEKFLELSAEVTHKLTQDDKVNTMAGFMLILMGATVATKITEKLFGEKDIISITKEEYSETTAKVIHDLVTEDKDVSLSFGLTGMLIVGEIKVKLFDVEDSDNGN